MYGVLRLDREHSTRQVQRITFSVFLLPPIIGCPSRSSEVIAELLPYIVVADLLSSMHPTETSRLDLCDWPLRLQLMIL
jgi:hypothetical protein